MTRGVQCAYRVPKSAWRHSSVSSADTAGRHSIGVHSHLACRWRFCILSLRMSLYVGCHILIRNVRSRLRAPVASPLSNGVGRGKLSTSKGDAWIIGVFHRRLCARTRAAGSLVTEFLATHRLVAAAAGGDVEGGNRRPRLLVFDFTVSTLNHVGGTDERFCV